MRKALRGWPGLGLSVLMLLGACYNALPKKDDRSAEDIKDDALTREFEEKRLRDILSSQRKNLPHPANDSGDDTNDGGGWGEDSPLYQAWVAAVEQGCSEDLVEEGRKSVLAETRRDLVTCVKKQKAEASMRARVRVEVRPYHM